MGNVYCRKCGEIWDYYYVSHEMSPADRSTFMKGLGCPKCLSRKAPETVEREKALASIIESLNDIEGQLKNLETALGVGAKRGAVSQFDAYNILEQFFLNCQVAEDRIKLAIKKDYITDTQLAALNKEIGEAVQRMIGASKQSSLVTQAMVRLAETNPIVYRTLQSYAT